METTQKPNFDFLACKAYAQKLSIAELLFAIEDCRKTIKAFESNGGHPCLDARKYYDQISCFNQELVAKVAELSKPKSRKHCRWICSYCEAELHGTTVEVLKFNFCPYCGIKI